MTSIKNEIVLNYLIKSRPISKLIEPVLTTKKKKPRKIKSKRIFNKRNKKQINLNKLPINLNKI